MFTGLVRDIGHVVAVEDRGGDKLLVIKPQKISTRTFMLGASLACDGVCFTVAGFREDAFEVHASSETLAKTTVSTWKKGTAINLEPSLCAGDEMGGHLVYGHVDGVGECVKVMPQGESTRLLFRVPKEFMAFIAPKGSITVNGVSLTVNEVEGNHFEVMIIPHTKQHTTLEAIVTHTKVNIEIDMLARYVARLREVGK
jgi:riboflavin synthase